MNTHCMKFCPAERLFALAVVLLLTSVTLTAQDVSEERAPVVSEEPSARKIDEFGRANGCDHGARLDGFAIVLMNNPDNAGYVIVYGPRGETAGSANYRAQITRDYLTQSRGIDPARITTVNGGRYKERGESFAELWLVPPGAEPPRPAAYESDDDKFTGLVAEYAAWDGIDLEGKGVLGPPIGNAKLAAFVDLLRSRPATRGYVVAFHDEDSPPGMWRRTSANVTDALKGAGVKDRFRVLFGGYAEEAKLQLWVMDADAPPPVAANMRERTPEEAIQLGAYDKYSLNYPENSDWVFKAIEEVLASDANLNACVFVQLPFVEIEEPGEVAAGDEEEAAETGERLPEVNLSLLVERWRGKLLEKKIANSRFVVQVVPPKDEFSAEGLDVWFVPKGAPLPDPFAEPDESHTPDEVSEP